MSAHPIPFPQPEKTADETAAWAGGGEVFAKSGEERRVGVELEFLGLEARQAATAVAECFGGEIKEVTRHRVRIADTVLGNFTAELDMKLAHDDPATEAGRQASDFGAAIRTFAGDMASGLLPMEVICPPVPLSEAHRLDTLLQGLRDLGATGGRDNLLLAVGAQFNPEPLDLRVETILAHLRAFILLEDWLFDEIKMDVSRRVLGFASPFPKPYGTRILNPSYQPTMARLIDDYIELNPTRNRALDGLPLFRHIDEERVVAALPNETINARPTFHYRLPNAEIDNHDWSLSDEWRRWRTVELLARRPEAIRIASEEWLNNDWSVVSRWKAASRTLARLIDAGELCRESTASDRQEATQS